jgi:hypothetical protein
MSRSRLADRLAHAALALLLYGFAAAHAATIIVAGAVKDSSTGAPLAGADVTIRHGATDLSSTISAADGAFQLPFEIVVKPEAQNLTLLVRKDPFVSSSHKIIVTAGRANATSFTVELVPQAVAECIRPSSRSVVVGYFRPSAASTIDPDIAARVADALNFDLLVRMQQGLSSGALPSIIACGGAKPRTVGDYASFAKVLRADAFLVGSVNDTALTKVKVEMAVIDGFGVLPAPLRASSREVNLDDPSVARLDASAHAAILTALVGGYELAGKFADCVDFTTAAARIVGTLPPQLQAARSRCEQRLPNRGLTSGGTP